MIFLCIPCLALVLYFAIAGIFFPKYRTYIAEGWKCFLDKLMGKKCSVSFDNRMRLALSTWLAKKGMIKLGTFLHNERNFNVTLTAVAIIFTVVSVYLFILLMHFSISPPCGNGTCSV